jgi:hypothetical protein
MLRLRSSLRLRAHALGAIVAPLALGVTAAPVQGQTDYYNTDAGRPGQIEDALVLERYGFELQAAPLRVERARGGVYSWGVEPELAYGVLPLTQLEVGFPLALVDAGPAGYTAGLAGVDVTLLQGLNVETAIPALALGWGVLLPAGALGPERAYASVKAIATRTLSWARFHANAQYTFGRRPGEQSADDHSHSLGAGSVELSRWLAGVAADKTFPLRSLLMTGEVYARKPLHVGQPVEWNAGTGARYQVSPRWAMDGGVGRRLNGDDRGWYVTVGAAYAFGVPGLMRLGRR